MTDVTAQAFREAAARKRYCSCGWQVHDDRDITMLLAAAEQREQLDELQHQWDMLIIAGHAGRDGEVPVTRTQQEAYEAQIATLTSENATLKAERDEADRRLTYNKQWERVIDGGIPPASLDVLVSSWRREQQREQQIATLTTQVEALTREIAK